MVVTRKNLTAGATVLAAGLLLLALGGAWWFSPELPDIGHGDVATLRASFEDWRRNYESKGGSPEVLKLNLGYSKVLSERYTKARGRLTLNLRDGRLAFKATGLAPGEYELWLVDNRPGSGRGVRPEASDRLLNVGRFRADAGQGSLETRLKAGDLLGFTLDTVALAAAGKSPVAGDNCSLCG